jgi:hypothetical protein
MASRFQALKKRSLRSCGISTSRYVACNTGSRRTDSTRRAQISLLEGCQTVLHGDCTDLARKLQASQTSGFFGSGKFALPIITQISANLEHYPAQTPCIICGLHLFHPSLFPQISSSQQPFALLFLCGHVVHATCVKGGEDLPKKTDSTILTRPNELAAERYSSKIA